MLAMLSNFGSVFLAASFAIDSTVSVVEDMGTGTVCTTISMAAGVTLQKEVILDVVSSDGSGESISQSTSTTGGESLYLSLQLKLVQTIWSLEEHS